MAYQPGHLAKVADGECTHYQPVICNLSFYLIYSTRV